jgi:multidrug efflux pump subunit AcrB
MWLIKASLKNPYMVATLVFMILALGYVALDRIPEDILPVFKSPAVEVLTYYQGMPASSIEKTITNRIERWVNQSPGAAKVESKSVPGVSVVKIYFRDDIDPTAALTMTNSLALGTLPTLPPNTLPPVVLPFDPTATMPLGILTVKNPHLNEATIKDVARIDVRNMLGAVPGCVAPVVIGGKDRTILIYLDPKKMEARQVSPLDVVKALKEGNLMVTPGTAYFGPNQVLLDTNVMVSKVSELNDLPIRVRPGDNVYLRDLGHAEDAYAIQTSRVRIDGQRQVYVPVYRQAGASSLAVAKGVKNYVKTMEDKLAALYPDTKLDFVMDQSVYVEKSISALITEGIIGACLVSVMILIFLGNWRMTLIASMSIPLAILGAIIGLYITNNTINAMTLGGLALAIGPLVDDAIVELENNHRNYSLGKSRVRAALDGCAEVMVPVLVATCTTNIVLAPVAMMPGMGGFLFKPLALSVTFAMVTSFILSRTFVPMMCSKFLPDEHRRTVVPQGQQEGAHAPAAGHGEAHAAAEHGHGHGHGHGEEPTTFFGKIHYRIEGFLDRLTRGYSFALEQALRYRFIVLGAIGLLFVGSLLLATGIGPIKGIGREFFPQVDAGQISVTVRAPSNLRLDSTERRVIAVEKKISQVLPKHEREMVVSELGLDPDWSAAYSQNSGQQDAVVRIQLSEERSKSAQEWAIELRHAFADDPNFNDLRFSFDTGGMVSTALNMGASSPIDIQVAGGKSAEVSRRVARRIRNFVAGIQGTADVRVLQRLDAPYLVINVDRQKAASVGLSAQDVILQVVAAMNSSLSINRNFWIDTRSGNQYFVAVQYPEDPDMRLEDVLNVFATGTNQPGTVKLEQLATFESRQDAVEINHVSLYRTFDVMVNMEGRDIGSVGGEIEHKMKAELPRMWADAAEHPVDWGYPDPTRADLTETQRNELQDLRNWAQAAKEASATGDMSKAKAPDKKPWIDEDGYRLPAKLRVLMMGEYERMNESFHHLVWGLAFAALLVYLLQVALFRSWVGPFIIMFTVPLGLIGVLTMLWLTNTSLNVQSEMGVIFLVGIAVNNGVLLVEFANKQRKLGAPIYKAITTAASIRFRPILMTFLATFLDLIPMAIGLERGSEATIPLARAVVGGLLTSTALTLFVVPIMYTLLLRDPLPPEVDIEGELADRPEELAAAPQDLHASAVAVVGEGSSHGGTFEHRHDEHGGPTVGEDGGTH